MLFVVAAALSAAAPVSAQSTDDPWPQFQQGPGRAGTASTAPAPPYAVSWQAAADIGDPTHWSGFPTPILTDSLAIVVGREDVAAVDLASGSTAWSVPRAIGPSSAAAVSGHTLLYVEGGGDESASASSSPTTAAPPSPSSSASGGASASPDGAASSSAAASPSTAPSGVSMLVAVDLQSRKRLWQTTLTDVSHTGVLVAGDLAVVGADDGQVSAYAVGDGTQRWSIHAGDHVLAPIAASDDLVVVSVRPESSSSTPMLLALHAADGSEAWRYVPPTSILDLGAPAIVGEAVDVVASDASVRSLSAADGSLRWASSLYTPTLGSPPVLSDDGLFVTDQSGTVYCFDPGTGAERWRFATNRSVVGAPIATPTAVLQPTNDGSIVAIDASTGHQIWSATVTDNVVFGLAASADVVVASHTGISPGFVALANDPTGVTEDITSPTTADPTGLAVWWLLAAVPAVVLLVLLGRWLDRRMGPPDLGAPEPVVDPWETDLEVDE